MLPYPKEFKGVIVVRDSAANTIQPLVCLSVDEAKEIKHHLDEWAYQAKFYRSLNHGKAYCMKLGRCRNRFEKRIEQAEKIK